MKERCATLRMAATLAVAGALSPLAAQTVLSLEPFYVLALAREPFTPLSAGTVLGGTIAFGDLPLSLALEGGARYFELEAEAQAVNLLGGGGLSFSLPLGPGLGLDLRLTGGVSWTTVGAQAGGTYASGLAPYGTLGVGASFPLGESLSFGPRASMRWDPGLGVLFDAGLGVSYRIQSLSLRLARAGNAGAGPRSATSFTALPPELDVIYPVFYKYFDEHALGSVRVENRGSGDMTDVTVSFYVKQYMDGPYEWKYPDAIRPGESASLPLYALLTEDILAVTEGTKAQAEIVVSATVRGTAEEYAQTASVRIADRNAMVWLDDRAAAAFITAKDPAVLTFSKGIIGGVKESMNPSLNKNFLEVMALHEALCEYGLAYATDPTSAYGSSAAGSATIDFLLFPRQTLEYKAGDCDDLSILYCALLESVGVETAFITVPGHIYVAASLGMSQAEAMRAFRRADDLVFRDGAAWLPLEVTARTGGFLLAWQEGAKEWREALSRGQAGFYPVHSAWETFEPVGLPGTQAIRLPDTGKVAARMAAESVRFVEKEIGDQVARLQAKLRTAQEDPKLHNELGVLYATYGLMDKASTEFQRAVAKADYGPALVNMGNVLYMTGDLERALGAYERAAKAQPEAPLVLLALARVNHDLENYGAAKRYYARLKAANPSLAEQFAYLDLKGEEGSRAADLSGAREVMLWSQ